MLTSACTFMSAAGSWPHLNIKLLLGLQSLLLLTLSEMLHVCKADFGVNRLAEAVHFLLQSCLRCTVVMQVPKSSCFCYLLFKLQASYWLGFPLDKAALGSVGESIV